MNLQNCIKDIYDNINLKIKYDLSLYLKSTLSNILGFTFYEIQDSTNIEIFTNTASNRLNVFLQSSQLLSDDFETALLLFTIAIAETDVYTEDIANKYLLANSKSSAFAYLVDNEFIITDNITQDISVNFDAIDASSRLNLAFCKNDITIFSKKNNIVNNSIIESFKNFNSGLQFIESITKLSNVVDTQNIGLKFANVIYSIAVMIASNNNVMSNYTEELLAVANEYLECQKNNQSEINNDLQMRCVDVMSKCLTKYVINLEIQHTLKNTKYAIETNIGNKKMLEVSKDTNSHVARYKNKNKSSLNTTSL
jgi:hypothetical protein